MILIAYASANVGAVEGLADLLKSWGQKKPIVCCLSSPGEIWDEEIQSLEEEGVPNYLTPERAARALGNLLRYQKLATRDLEREYHMAYPDIDEMDLNPVITSPFGSVVADARLILADSSSGK